MTAADDGRGGAGALGEAEREALRVAYRGPWGDDMVRECPPRILDEVARIRDAAVEAAVAAERERVKSAIRATRSALSKYDTSGRELLSNLAEALDPAPPTQPETEEQP